MSEAQGDGDASPATTAQAEEPKRFTDAELVEKLGALIKDRTDDGVTPSITASRETVRVETARVYASIQEMFAEGRNRWPADCLLTAPSWSRRPTGICG